MTFLMSTNVYYCNDTVIAYGTPTLACGKRKKHTSDNEVMLWMCYLSPFCQNRRLMCVRLTQGTEWKPWRTDKSACEQNQVLSRKAHSNISYNQSTVGFLVRRTFLTTFKSTSKKSMRAPFCPTPCFSYGQQLLNGENDGLTGLYSSSFFDFFWCVRITLMWYLTF